MAIILTIAAAAATTATIIALLRDSEVVDVCLLEHQLLDNAWRSAEPKLIPTLHR